MKVACTMGASREFYVASWSVIDPETFVDCIAQQIHAAEAVWPLELAGLALAFDVMRKRDRASKPKGKTHATDHE